MLKKLKEKLNSAKIALTLGMSNVDQEILNGNFSKAPEGSSMVSPNYSRNGMLRGVQMGVIKEEHLKKFYHILNVMDKLHTRTKVIKVEQTKLNEDGSICYVNGVAQKEFVHVVVRMTDEEMAEVEANRQKIGDFMEGYETVYFYTNKKFLLEDKSMDFMADPTKMSNSSLDNVATYIWTLLVNRDNSTPSGIIKIEDYTNEVLVKQVQDQDTKDMNFILEFYCMNWNVKEGASFNEEKDAVWNEVNDEFTLANFINFKSVELVRSTATRNWLVQTYDIKSFHSIKKLDKGSFVVKFNGIRTSE